MSVADFELQCRGEYAETVWPAIAKTFTIGPFIGQVCGSIGITIVPLAFSPGALGKADSTHGLQGSPGLNQSAHSIPLS